jgi:uncharacterized protein YjbI with pentapeptide repeats
MPNPEHVDLVKQGAKAVAGWRKSNPDGWLDLSEADLSGTDASQADLSKADLHLACLDGTMLEGANLSGAYVHSTSLNGANLNGANLKEANLDLCQLRETDLGLAFLGGASLREADLSGANLYFANLRGAVLTGAVLKGANLKEADLRDAWLSRTDLTGVDLRQADLCGTKLDQAVLTEADLTGARCGGTLFGQLDLGEVHGLDALNHLAPSTLGIDTLYLSKGRLPAALLRGCGVPSDLVAQLIATGQAQTAASFLSCFLSYGARDQEFARQLGARLRQFQLRVWDASENISGGKTPEAVDPGLRNFDRWIVVLSKNSMKSDWLATEVRRARKAESRRPCKLIPIRLVDQETLDKWLASEAGRDAAAELAGKASIDFSNWQDAEGFEEALNRLLKELRTAGARAR